MVDTVSETARAAHQAAVAELLREPDADGAQRGAFYATVRGTCMQPVLSDGQRVRIRRSRWALPGDIVAFERGAGDARLAVHRLLGARPSRVGWVFITQADKHHAPDPAFAAERLLGVADGPVSLSQRVVALSRLLPALVAPLRGAGRRPRRISVPVSPSAPK